LNGWEDYPAGLLRHGWPHCDPAGPRALL